ncbi:MAG TPA: serine hydrolase domain-containing protein [Gaiellaceae bacterium]|nr:serine hydrolase domain-containing protein [Gaiellaceae bacterium]
MNRSFSSQLASHCEAAALAWNVPALAAGIAVGGRVETASVGCDVETVFRVASVTKPFTASLAVSLLDLEAPTGIWPGDVRVRHLLSHTSGFDCELPEADLVRFGDGDEALAGAIAELPGVRRWLGVEQVWSYANTGYWLAGFLAAAAAGSSYEDALTEHVIRRAGLESTSFGPADLPGSGAGVVEGDYPRARRPSGGLSSNVPDLLQFGRWHLAQANGARMRIVHGRPVAGVYGLGLFGERVAGVEVWGHSGSWGGYQASFLVVPDMDAVFVGLTNSGVGGQALRDLEDVFFEQVLGSRREPRVPVELSPEQLDAFAGEFANSEAWYEVTPAVNGLVVTIDDVEYAARPLSETTFEITEGDLVSYRFDFPLEGFARIGSRLAERVA